MDVPDQRAKELTASTASPTPFTVLYSRQVSDCTAIEDAMHRAFAAERVNNGREFFRISLFEAARTLDMLAGSAFSKFEPRTPFAELFNSFPDDGSPRELTEVERRACRDLERRSAASLLD